MSGRRETLKILGAIGATCATPYSSNELYGQHAGHDGAPLVQIQMPAGPKTLTAAEYALLSRMADLIIPATDTPGAVAAGVPRYMDYVAAVNAGMRQLLAKGCQWLDAQCGKAHGKRFVELDEAAQVALLEPLCARADRLAVLGQGAMEERFFKAVKSLTADGYFTSKTGLVDTLRYTGNTVMGEYPSCEG
ncbi:MAG: gluconate 2-dehydrogenase subunit 3 family protein [Bryobacterales bacterium]|mgnify:CR=1 FL=1|nr:gluconate 2-dehydrogenase subunit 3 family protein [Bryobacterales bacterium]